MNVSCSVIGSKLGMFLRWLVAGHHMAWKHLSLGLIFAIGLSQPAFATPIVTVLAIVDGPGAGFYEASTAGDPAFAGATIVSGDAFGDTAGGFANVKVGPFSECPLCGIAGPPGGGGSAFARAEASGFAGSLRARAQSSADSSTDRKHAGAAATLTDTISFLGVPVVNFDIALSSFLIGEGFSSLIFSFGFHGGPGCGAGTLDGQCAFGRLAQLRVSEDRDTSEGVDVRFSQLTIDGVVVATGDIILDSYEFSYDFTPLLGGPFGDSFPIFAELIVGTQSGEDTEGFPPLGFASVASMAADQSVFLQMDNVISANGYNYLGRPTPSVVPAPTSLALLAIGLAGLGGIARRRMR